MKVIAQEPWNWTLLEDVSDSYFSVLCGSIGMFTIDFQLNSHELAKINSNIDLEAAELARLVRSNQEDFGQRHLGDFSNRADVRQAGLRWRKERRSDA